VPSVRDLARKTVDGDKLPAAGGTWEGYRGYAGRSTSLGMDDVPNGFSSGNSSD
jgi:hypothetical protein